VPGAAARYLVDPGVDAGDERGGSDDEQQGDEDDAAHGHIAPLRFDQEKSRCRKL
jgi:hypothetical protein